MHSNAFQRKIEVKMALVTFSVICFFTCNDSLPAQVQTELEGKPTPFG